MSNSTKHPLKRPYRGIAPVSDPQLKWRRDIDPFLSLVAKLCVYRVYPPEGPMSVFSFRSRLGLTVALGSLLLEGLVGCGNRAGSSSGSTLRLPDRIDGTSLSRYHDTAGHETAIYFAVTHLFPIPVGPADRKVTALYWY